MDRCGELSVVLLWGGGDHQPEEAPCAPAAAQALGLHDRRIACRTRGTVAVEVCKAELLSYAISKLISGILGGVFHTDTVLCGLWGRKNLQFVDGVSPRWGQSSPGNILHVREVAAVCLRAARREGENLT